MVINVEYLDTAGALSNRQYNMSRLAFFKHLAIAGQGYAPAPQKLFRTLGMFLHYSMYIKKHEFDNNRFSEPPIQLSDPTEKGQFSNLAGKAIADFLSKKIDNSIFTVNYEAAMRVRGLKLIGSKPDLIAHSPTGIFAVEAKGRNESNPGDMFAHKAQAGSGKIKVNFSVACVSYNLYRRVTCKYHDPYNADVPYDSLSLQVLTRNYYSGLSGFLDKEMFDYREVSIQGERFFEVELSYRNFDKRTLSEFSMMPHIYRELLDHFRPKLILPRNIFEFAENGITNNVEPFIFKADEDEYLYIDNDRVGLSIR